MTSSRLGGLFPSRWYTLFEPLHLTRRRRTSSGLAVMWEWLVLEKVRVQNCSEYLTGSQSTAARASSLAACPGFGTAFAELKRQYAANS